MAPVRDAVDRHAPRSVLRSPARAARRVPCPRRDRRRRPLHPAAGRSRDPRAGLGRRRPAGARLRAPVGWPSWTRRRTTPGGQRRRWPRRFVGAGGLALADGVVWFTTAEGLHRARVVGSDAGTPRRPRGHPRAGPAGPGGDSASRCWAAGSTSCAAGPWRSGRSRTSTPCWPASSCTASAAKGIAATADALWLSDDLEQTVYCLDPITLATRFMVVTPLERPDGHRRPAPARRGQRHPARGLLRERAVPQGQPVDRPVLGGPLPRPGPDPPAPRAPRSRTRGRRGRPVTASRCTTTSSSSPTPTSSPSPTCSGG